MLLRGKKLTKRQEAYGYQGVRGLGLLREKSLIKRQELLRGKRITKRQEA